jgi:hypothetical protein
MACNSKVDFMPISYGHLNNQESEILIPTHLEHDLQNHMMF